MDRQARLAIDLGGEQVALRRLESHESLGEPFTMYLDVIAPLGEIDLLPHLGKPAAVTASQSGTVQRRFHGVIVAGESLHEDETGFHYRLTLRPWTELISANRRYAIFQDKNALDIVRAVLDRSGVARVDYGRLSRSRAVRPYCVQYGESDFAFVSRLLEEEGIYYHFRHEADAHVMVLCEGPSSHVKGVPDRLRFNPTGGSMSDAEKRVEGGASDLQGWQERVASTAQARVHARDWNFTRAADPMKVDASGESDHPHDVGEIERWPGHYRDTGEGQTRTDVRLEAARAERALYVGETQAAGVTAGALLSVYDHPAARFNADYLVVRAHHVIAPESYRSGGEEGETRVGFEAVRSETLFRTAHSTPRPVVRGPETAVVTGPAGEEIFTDEYGRVKVRFHWDRADTPGERATCWIRVSQTGGLGNLILPRVGHEVIVDFLHGDPDRPIVVGRVFNSVHRPIYPLPEHKTRALWRTKRYGRPGDYGGAEGLDTGEPGANELRFEDKGGEEEVFLHAERDMNTRVRRSDTAHVGLDREEKIGQDRTEAVGRNEKVKVGGSRRHDVAKDDTLEVGQALRIKAGTTIHIEAGTKITLKVGESVITIDPSNIKAEAALQALLKAGLQVDVKGVMTNVNGDGMLKLKGGMTLINT